MAEDSSSWSHLSSNISTSGKFLISMAHLLDPRGSIMAHPPIKLQRALATYSSFLNKNSRSTGGVDAKKNKEKPTLLFGCRLRLMFKTIDLGGGVLLYFGSDARRVLTQNMD